MTKYTLITEFGTGATADEVRGWMQAVQQAAPEGAVLTLRTEPFMVEAEELTPEFVGHNVQFHTHDGRDVKGTLEGVHHHGGKIAESVVLVVNGEAWPLNYGLVTVTDW